MSEKNNKQSEREASYPFSHVCPKRAKLETPPVSPIYRNQTKRETAEELTNQKLDEILDLTRAVNHKIDRLDGRVDDIDVRLAKVENSLAKLGVRSALVGGLGGLLVSVGFELIKAKFGG
nr:MAG TPA: hemolysin [Caudoviricetes sp.]